MKFITDNNCADNVVDGKEITLDDMKDYHLEWAECPYCHGLFGVDCAYLEQVQSDVDCPMCGNEVYFDGWE